jgi:hypothetical protein
MPLAAVVELLLMRIEAIRSGVKAGVVEIAPSSMTIGEFAQMFLDHLFQRVESGMPEKLARPTCHDSRAGLKRFLAAVRPNLHTFRDGGLELAALHAAGEGVDGVVERDAETGAT